MENKKGTHLKNAQSLGGSVTAITRRKKALIKYYESPNVCQSCGILIEVKENQTVSDIKKQRFCCQSCARRKHDDIKVLTLANCGIQVNATRANALVRYYKEPAICNFCNKLIEVKVGQPAWNVKVKKYCNQSCAAKFNNRKHPKRHALTESNCKRCDILIKFERNSRGDYKRKKYCNECLAIVRGEASLKGTQNKIKLEEVVAGDGRIMIPAPAGYKGTIYTGRYIYRYRYVMEQHLRRLLSSDEVVHHKNEDRTDDRLENLELVSRSSHAKIHAKESEKSFLECANNNCDNTFYRRSKLVEYKRKHGQKNFYCCRSCVVSGQFQNN